MKIRNLALLSLSTALLASCATTDSAWLYEHDGNEFNVSSGRLSQDRFLTINNSLRTWNGSLKGGEEKLEQRKTFLVSMAQREMNKICKDAGYKTTDEPSFGMQDKNPMTFGGGLIGVLIAEAASSYDNLPVSIHYSFTCNDDNEDGELAIRK